MYNYSDSLTAVCHVMQHAAGQEQISGTATAGTKAFLLYEKC